MCLRTIFKRKPEQYASYVRRFVSHTVRCATPLTLLCIQKWCHVPSKEQTVQSLTYWCPELFIAFEAVWKLGVCRRNGCEVNHGTQARIQSLCCSTKLLLGKRQSPVGVRLHGHRPNCTSSPVFRVTLLNYLGGYRSPTDGSGYRLLRDKGRRCGPSTERGQTGRSWTPWCLCDLKDQP